jgi:N-acetylmuramoyl-L-alanine amidase
MEKGKGKIMRDINKHIIHCSATPNQRDTRIEEIKQWHLDRGWSDIGYHFVIHRDGSLHYGRHCSIIGAHCKGFNADSIGTCLIGLDSFTTEQFKTLIKLDKMLKHMYNKDMTTHGHNEFTDLKTCPNFNVSEILNIIGE